MLFNFQSLKKTDRHILNIKRYSEENKQKYKEVKFRSVTLF